MAVKYQKSSTIPSICNSSSYLQASTGWEWVQDTWHDDYTGAPNDGTAWEDGISEIRVGRGGSFMDGPNICKSSFRGSLDANSRSEVLGFRVVKDV